MSGHGGTGVRPLERGLVLDLRLSEGAGLIAHDVSGNRNHGTLVNGPAWGTGKYGSGIDFDATTKHVNCGNDVSLDVTEITISAWVNLTSYEPTGARRIIDKNRETAYALGVNAAGGLFFGGYIGGVAQMLQSASGVVPLATEVHVVVTYDGSTVRYYADGEYLEDDTPSPAGNLGTNVNPLYISISAGNYWWDGMLDEIKIWEHALTDEEVALDHAQRGRI